MKRCFACNALMDDQAAFCPMCGTDNSFASSTQTAVSNPYAETTVLNVDDAPQNTYMNTSIQINNTSKLIKQKKTVIVCAIVSAVFLLAFAATVIWGIFASQTAYAPADILDVDDNYVGEYVTADLNSIMRFAVEYSQKKSPVSESNYDDSDNEINRTNKYFYCFAYDYFQNVFIIKVPYNYYLENLEHMEADENEDLDYINSETIYGYVASVDIGDDIDKELRDLVGDEFVEEVSTFQVNVLDGPKKDYGNIFLVVFAAFVLLLCSLGVFIPKYKKYNRDILYFKMKLSQDINYSI